MRAAADALSATATPVVDVAPDFADFNDLNLLTEEQFVDWFRLNFSLFGVRRIIKLDRFFPDCRAEMFDGRIVDIELEYHAKNFRSHRHDSSGCDLILCYAKSEAQERFGNTPILAIFNVRRFTGNGEFDLATKKLTPFFRRLVELARQQMLAVLGPPRPTQTQ